MLSIHAHYFELRDGVKPPEGVQIMPLEDAVAFLEEDLRRGSPGAASRARRAIARLASVSAGAPLPREVADRYSKAIETLGGDPRTIRETLPSLEPAALPDAGAPDAAKRQRLTSIARREVIATNLDTERLEECAWRSVGEPDVSPPGQPEASYSVDIIVPFSAERVREALDPQTWDHCSKFFSPPPNNTCLAKDGTPPTCLPGDGASPFPFPPGSPYENELLFERFSCPNCLNLQIKNLLKVTTGPKEDRVYQVHYELERYLEGQGDGLTSEDLALKKDTGDLWVRKSGENGEEAVVHADKTIRFNEPIVNAAYLGGLMVAELGGELAEVACCAIEVSGP